MVLLISGKWRVKRRVGERERGRKERKGEWEKREER